MAIINGTPGIDILLGTLGNDQIFDGGGGSDTITALSGNDIVTVTGGIDTADLGLGTSDRLIIDWADATGSILDIELLVGTVLLGYAGAFADGLTREVTFLGVEHFTIRTGSGNDRIVTGNGNDVLELGAGDDFGNVGSGTDSADGGSGTDGISYDQSGTATAIVHDLAANSYTGPGSYSNFEYFGAIQTGSGNDRIVTTAIDRDETIVTGGGDDSVTVSGGSDVVSVGGGSDELIVDYSASTTAVTGGGTGGSGSIADGEGRSVAYSGVERFVIRTGSGNDSVVITGAASVTYDLGGGNNTVVGGSGDDLFDASQGNDSIDGGGGSDTVSYENNPAAGQTVDLDAGTSSGGGGSDSLVNIENVEGSAFDDVISGDENANRIDGNGGDDRLAGRDGDDLLDGGDGNDDLDGGAGTDTLSGGAGNDRLDGGSGADSMAGGNGDDVYIVDDAGDAVTEAVNSGRDRVETSLASYTLGANVEDLTYTGGSSFIGEGNVLDNAIVGGSGNDRLFGRDGNDILSGGNGSDVIDGGTGADSMLGGAGNDIYVVDDAGDVVTEIVGEGTDHVDTSLASYTLTANVENLEYTGSLAFAGTGNALGNIIVGGVAGDVLAGLDGDDTLGGEGGDDTLNGGNGADRLIGGSGVDTMNGGAGNDLLIVDVSGDIANGGDGIDTVHFASSIFTAYTVRPDVENFRSLDVFVNVTLNALDNIFTGGPDQDLVFGGDGNDTMYGYGEADLLSGQGGNDILYGGDSNDQLSGGDGNDRIYGGNDSDDIDAGNGNDTIFGEAGDDRIFGGAGVDIMHGGTGADRFDFNSLSDTGNTLATSDRIVDFNRAQGDVINLFGIDANTNVGGNDAFSFIGTGAFSAAGQLRYENVAGRTVVSGDVNGDGVADFFIRLDGVQVLTEAAFFL